MVSSYETSRQLPTLPTLYAILKVLDANLYDLQDAMDLAVGREARRPIPSLRDEEIEILGSKILAVLESFVEVVVNRVEK